MRQLQDNLYLGPDANVRFALNNLRAHEGSGSVSSTRTTIMDGITLSHGDGGQLAGKYRCGRDNMLSLNLSCKTRTAPHWQCLTVPMGAMNLAGAGVVGIVARSSAPQSTISHFTLRSGRDGDFVDQPFGKSMVSFASPSTHLDAIEIGRMPNLPIEAQWRDLLLFFRPGPLEIEILDLRVFVV